MQASHPQEIVLLQKYQTWTQDIASNSKQYAVAVHICCNGEDDAKLFRSEFALHIMNEHIAKKLPWDVLVWRAWLIWWTRAEQLQRWATEQQVNAQGSARTLLICANANAWYKAWHWALEEQPENVGLYLAPARERFARAMTQIKEEKTVLRRILQIAMNEEPWYETAKLAEQKNISV